MMAKGRGILITETDWMLDINPVRGSDGKIKSGLKIGKTTEQNQAVILAAHPGEWKESPTLGVGIADVVLDNDLLAWRHRIRQQMEAEGMRVNVLQFDSTKEFFLDAEYYG